MKINKILGAILFLGSLLPLTGAQAQELQLKCMSWNVKSLELYDNTNVTRDITRFVEAIRRRIPMSYASTSSRPPAVRWAPRRN